MIERVGIVGAGIMGKRIAFACLSRGVATRLYDISPEASLAAASDLRQLLQERVKDLTVVTSLDSCVRDVDLVIETVPESVELKRKVFAEIDRHAGSRTLIGTNTSSIPGSRLADATRRPALVFNCNWGHIDHPKVELMPHPGTAPATMDAAEQFIRALGLVPIRDRKEILGYGSNRIWRAVKKEVLRVIAEGVLDAKDVDRAWMLDWHVPLGPCALMDRIGLDVVRDIELVYYESTGDPSDRPPQFLEEMIAAGKLGEKTGEGFYTYPNPAYEQEGFLQ